MQFIKKLRYSVTFTKSSKLFHGILTVEYYDTFNQGDTMRTIWKWILGIVLVLIVVSAVAAVAFMWRNHAISVSSFRAMPFDRNGTNPMPRDFDRLHHGPMMRFGRGGFGLFGPFLFLGGLLKLVFFGALLYGAYWLGRRNARVVLSPSTPRPTPSTTETVVEPEAPPKNEE